MATAVTLPIFFANLSAVEQKNDQEAAVERVGANNNKVSEKMTIRYAILWIIEQHVRSSRPNLSTCIHASNTLMMEN